ncbi:12015_t:CDS:2 [Gigaspora margarita]|uniref:12015_t:CDS:1 n=1 Tax=Gigaspora margarita TaxID=4874 RepID=A0ABN7ULI7_GIGMA|nr:12015_t:CDS:2 [Gigaspora margarita]
MEEENYAKLLQYLLELKLPEGLTKEQARKLKSQARHYLIREGVLYQRNRQDPDQPLRALKRKQGHRYLVVSVEYVTKWPEARALLDCSAESVAAFMLETIICQHGVPISATELWNWSVKKQKLSTNYPPRTTRKPMVWWKEPALFACRTAQNNTTKFDPFYLVYGREATLPVDLIVKSYPVEEVPDEHYDALLLKRTFRIIDDLFEA